MCRRGNFSRLAGNNLSNRGYKSNINYLFNYQFIQINITSIDVFNVIGGINEYGKQFDNNIPFI